MRFVVLFFVHFVVRFLALVLHNSDYYSGSNLYYLAHANFRMQFN